MLILAAILTCLRPRVGPDGRCRDAGAGARAATTTPTQPNTASVRDKLQINVYKEADLTQALQVRPTVESRCPSWVIWQPPGDADALQGR